jgi:hypothetical protein
MCAHFVVNGNRAKGLCKFVDECAKTGHSPLHVRGIGATHAEFLLAISSVSHVSRLEPRGSGAPGETRTPDPLLRRQTLYPAELRARP